MQLESVSKSLILFCKTYGIFFGCLQCINVMMALQFPVISEAGHTREGMT